ncbi:unnamed protein product [Euphydryas editha]|uniref:THAP-type domain-containing protein n=1 Tax=Euphydryas editha TaxID=104508 RepID=A0AAU9T8K0_EUPED|nr:unnamed protein product [Euphydryas editha]
MPYRCIFGCKGTDVLHVFPKPDKFPDRFKTWVNIVGGKPETLSDYEFYKKMRICDIHFTNDHRNRFKRLNALAIPSLHLPGTSGVQQPIDTNDRQPAASLRGTSGVQQPIDTNDSEPAASLKGTSGVQQPIDTNDSEPAASLKDASRKSYCSRLNTLLPFRKKIKYLQTEISSLRKKVLLYKERVANAEKMSQNVVFQQVVKHMTKPSQLFLHMQLQAKKKPKGRRFTIEEKILSLSLYKKSPKCYRLLYKYFALPSSNAMKRLLSQVKLAPGINKLIFAKINKTLLNKAVSDRLCSLIFDEMSITPQIFYSPQKDQLEGFTSNDKEIFADHALVFMVKGVKNNFKQPVAYYFTNSLTKLELKQNLRSVIDHCFQSSLIIVNTVCDQSSVNVGAITELVEETKATYLRQGKEWRHEVMRFKGHVVVPLYDTPHLIKGIRNNLITKDLSYVTNNEKKIVKWDYFKMVYDADKSYAELRLLNKITEEHINPEKINKMRVKSATQLFSHSVAVVTEHLTARGDLPIECRHLVDLTLLIDDLFDSLNVNSLCIPNGKDFKGPVKRNTPHHELWKKAKLVLRTITFIQKVTVQGKVRLVEKVVPSVRNLIKTIEGMELLWQILSRRYRLDLMMTRNFNQDPLENFFGNIRSYGARNVAPNTMGFEGAFKALLLNNFSSPHSGKANCEEDLNKCLQSLDFFLKEKNVTPNVSEENNSIIHFNSEVCFDQQHEIDAGQSNYVCGWVLTKCLKNVVKGCKNCKSTLLDNTSNTNNSFIKAKEYQKKKWLCYPSQETENLFKEIQSIAISFLKRNVPKKCLKSNIISLTDLLVMNPFQCPKHNDQLYKMFTDTTINIIIYS